MRTNTALLTLRAADLIAYAGRLHECELWDKNEFHRELILRDIHEAIEELSSWTDKHKPHVVEAA